MLLATCCKWEVIVKVNWRLSVTDPEATPERQGLCPSWKQLHWNNAAFTLSLLAPLSPDRQANRQTRPSYYIHKVFLTWGPRMGLEVRFPPPWDNFFRAAWSMWTLFQVEGPWPSGSLEGIHYSKEFRNCCWNWMFLILIFSLACIPWLSFLANLLQEPLQVWFGGLHFSHMGFRTYTERTFCLCFPWVPPGRVQGTEGRSGL